VFTFASANPPAVRFVDGPEHGGLLLPTSQAPEVTHRGSVMVGCRWPALEVVDALHVAGRVMDQAIGGAAARRVALVELEADVCRR
jgi:hypothetical protein